MKPTIVCVDDEPQVLKTLMVLFQKQYNVLPAESGEEALKMFMDGHQVSVIISDQRMPTMLGVDLLKHIKRISPTTVRILLTGYADLDAAVRSINVGDVYRFVNKPWQNDKLRRTVEMACGVSTALQALVKTKVVSESKDELPNSNSSSKRAVMILESNPNDTRTLGTLFETKYRVISTRTAKEAFDLLKTNQVAILIAGGLLPDADVIDFISTVKALYPDIISILLSDIKDAKVAIRLLNEGQVFRYLMKPLQERIVVNSVKLAVALHELYLANPKLNPRRIEIKSDQKQIFDAVQNLTFFDALAVINKDYQLRLTY